MVPNQYLKQIQDIASLFIIDAGRFKNPSTFSLYITREHGIYANDEKLYLQHVTTSATPSHPHPA
jgi:hypothetical protein